MAATVRNDSAERAQESPPEPSSVSSNDSHAITRYVQALAKDREAPPALFEAAWHALRRALRQELQARSLWRNPPTYVGIYGHNSWTPRTRQRAQSVGPLDELLQDCFSFVILERLPQMLARLRVHPHIEGDVRLYVRNFVHGRQKDHDPLGFRLYELLREAVALCLERRELFVIEGDRSIRNETILSPQRHGSAAAAREIGPIAVGSTAGTVADLFSTGPGSRKRAVGSLRAHLLELESLGIPVFRFKSALDGLKQDVRTQLSGLLESQPGNTLWIREIKPETWVEEIESYRKLVDCVTQYVERWEGRPKTHSYLHDLWGLLHHFAASLDDRLPPQREIARTLGIPRSQIPPLLESLAEFARRCARQDSMVLRSFPVAAEGSGTRHER